MADLIIGSPKMDKEGGFLHLDNVLCELKKEFKIDAVYLIDTPQTIEQPISIKEHIKDKLGSRDVFIGSLEVDEINAAERIPEFIGRIVICDARKISDLIIDLTIGPKFVTNILYAAANFCHVKNIRYFSIKSDQLIANNQKSNELMPHEYDYVCLPLLKGESLDLLSKHSLFELVDYKRDVENLAKDFPTELANELKREMLHAVQNYFNNDYRNVINIIGGLLKSWTDRLYTNWEIHGVFREYLADSDNKLTKKDWEEKLKDMSQVFDALKEARIKETPLGFISKPDLLKDSIPLSIAGNMLDIVKAYGIIAAYSDNRYQIDRDDAKLVLNIGFTFASKCKQSGILIRGD